MTSYILSLIIFTPIILSIPVLFINTNKGLIIKKYTLVVSSVVFITSLYLFYIFNEGNPNFQFIEKFQWVSDFNIFYLIGIDGISLLLVMLTTLIFPLTVLSMFNSINYKVKEFCFLFLILEGSLLGVFLSLDLILFYVFWEMILIPMYFIIGIWGGNNKYYATVKFFLFTMFGSLLMLIAIIWLANYSAPHLSRFTTDYLELKNVSAFIPAHIQMWMFIFFGLSFAIKVPIFPFHTWLPDAHTEAPTAGSVILAAILLKMGTYGFLRYSIGLFPVTYLKYDYILAILGVIGIIYGALVCIAQKDMKKLVAYSSVSHMGFVVLGLAGLTVESLQGSLIQMVNHGLSTGALFLFVGYLYDRRHTREIADFGGLTKLMPVYSTVFLIVCLSSIGLPGLNGFIGEFMILSGAFISPTLHNHTYTIIATLGIVLAAVYTLWMYQRLMLGPLQNKENNSIIDLSKRELATIIPIIFFIVWIGVYPNTFLKKSELSIQKIVQQLEATKKNMLKIY
ncbi:MAG: complex I subunit 4 family protein [Ignavibacteria bacterium]